MRRSEFPPHRPVPTTLWQRPSLYTDARETSTTDSSAVKIIMLGGAIKWWWQATCLNCGHWDEAEIMRGQACPATGHTGNHSTYVWWNSIEHRAYVAWRDEVRAALIDAGYLTYAPWMAFKGTWDERAQVVNDAVLTVADAFVVMSPPYAITDGTDMEREVCRALKVPVIDAPPPKRPEWSVDAEIAALMRKLVTA